MNHRQTLTFAAAFAAVLHIAGCDRRPAVPRDRNTPTHEAALPAAGAPSVAAIAPPAVPTPAALDAAGPLPDAVLREWAAAIEARDWEKVRALWGNGGADSGLAPAGFAARWGSLRRPRVTIGPGTQEGAAGSLYYTAPVRIADGARTFAGEVTLRRVNNVPGATPEQLRWHIDGSTRAPWTDPS